MHEVFNNTFHEHEMILYRNNIPTDADSTPLISVYDANTEQLIETGSATKNSGGPGEYYYQITPQLSSVDRMLKIQWNYSFNSSSISESSFTNVVTPYATLPEIVSELNIGVQPYDDDYVDPEVILFAERMARATIQNYTMQNFNKRYDSQMVWGFGTDSLFLTEKMLSVSKIYEETSIIYDTTASYSDLGADLNLSDTGRSLYLSTANSTYTVPRPTQDVYPVMSKFGRFYDNKQYTIEGVIGWQYVPQDIRTATIMLVADYMSNDFQWKNKYLSKVNLSEITFELNAAAFVGTGNSMVDSILDAYKNIGIVLI